MRRPGRSRPVREQEQRELELKYSVSDHAAARAALGGDEVGGLQAGPWRAVEVTDQYIDTSDGALARAGYGARLRHGQRRTTLTVKGAPRPGGQAATRGALHDRLELEGRATRRLDPQRWSESAARSVVEAAAGGQELHTLFYIDQRREERELSRDGVVLARLTLDSAAVRRFRRQLGDFTTLEIESVEPDAAESGGVLETMAAALGAVAALEPEPRSKEDIARAIVERASASWRAATPPRKPDVRADDLLAEAGRKVLRMHLLRMLAAEPGVRAGTEVVAVHKMRVATRRIRAAWRVFGAAVGPRLRRRYVAELRSVARALGAVRDFDVQLERLAAYRLRVGGPAGAALEPLADEWHSRREIAAAELRQTIASDAYERFVGDYHAFAEAPQAAEARAGRRVRDAAGGLVWAAYEAMLAHDATTEFADAAALHDLRIDGKRLRYTLEFLREVLPGPADLLIADVTRLQDHLGLLNDAQIAAEMARGWLLSAAGSLSDDERRATGAYMTSAERDVARLRRGFATLWRRLSGRTFRRRLALAAADAGAQLTGR